MPLKFDALFVHPDPELPKKLSEGLWPEIQFIHLHRVHSLAEAFQKHVEHSYSICFIDSSYTDGVENFFKDMRTLGRDQSCFFFQIVKGYDPDGEVPRLIHGAIAGLISTTPTSAERSVLIDLLQVEFHRAEVTRRVADVKDAVGLLVKEVDHIARERQRGKMRGFDRSIKSFVQMHLAFDEEVFSQYIEALTTLASTAEAFDANSLAVPETMLGKNLPCLSKDTYTGQSSRVWTMLLKRFGKRVESKP